MYGKKHTYPKMFRLGVGPVGIRVVTVQRRWDEDKRVYAVEILRLAVDRFTPLPVV